MDDRARIYEINKILNMHGLDHGKREAAFGLLWIALHPKSKSTLTKTMCDDGSVRRFQRWTLSNNGRNNEMKVELT
jgi:hypothetical protein